MINVRFQRISASVQSDYFADVKSPYRLKRHAIRDNPQEFKKKTKNKKTSHMQKNVM